jgi:hypothetical protein
MIHPKHLHPARYVFHGQCSGLAAHIRRPQDSVLSVQACSSLPTVGGHCEYYEGPGTLGKWVAFDSAWSSCDGDYVDAAEGVATTTGDLDSDKAATEIRSAARVRRLVVLGRVHVAEAAIGIVARSVPGNDQPRIRLEGNVLNGVRIDNSRLEATLAEDFYCRNDTLDKLRDAYRDGLPEEYQRMFLPCVPGQEEVTGFPETDDGTVKCTLVQDLAWDGPPHPSAQIFGHVVVVPDFGAIYFGEMFVTAVSRRVTMVRFQLGSPDGGEVSAADGESNGGGFPPTGG